MAALRGRVNGLGEAEGLLPISEASEDIAMTSVT